MEPAPLWRVYADLGWTELIEPAETVELAIVLEELGWATDPTPYLATMTWFAPLAPGVLRPGQSATAVFDGVTARRDGDGWLLDGTARHVLDGDRADWLAVVTEVSFSQVRVTEHDRSTADPERARHLALTGLALAMVGSCRRIL
nr:hypothetical protein [Frankia sp. Cr1]